MPTLAQTLLAVLLCCLGWTGATAETYPAKPVRLIVPFPPGGAADILGRILAQRLSQQLGQQVLVDNRAGASGNIGAEAAARAQADGYTVLLGALTSHAINHTLERKALRYDLERDLSPITIVATVPYVVVTHPSVPARTMHDLVAYARAKPGHLSYGSSGAGAPQRLAAEMLRLRAGIDIVHVPYKGSGQVITDLLGGQILVAFESLPATLPHIRAGKLRPLAVTAAQRVPMLPEVPTMAESKFSNFEVSSMFGILAPAGTPRSIVERLNTGIARVMQLPEVKDAFQQQGAFATSTTPAEAGARIRSEIAMWAAVIDAAGIKPD